MPLTSEQYAEMSLTVLVDFVEDYKEESQQAAKIGGRDGYEIIYTGSIFGLGMKWIQRFVVAGEYAYVITGTDYPGDFQAETLRAIMSTFEFLS